MLTPCRGAAGLEGPQVKAGPLEALSEWPSGTGCQEGQLEGRGQGWGPGAEAQSQVGIQSSGAPRSGSQRRGLGPEEPQHLGSNPPWGRWGWEPHSP